MDQSSNLFSYCIGGFALISTLASITIFSRGYLPAAQMKILTELLDETKMIYEKAEAEQLLPDENFRREARNDLLNYESAASALRAKAYESMSLQEEFLAAINGLSRNIMQLCYKVKKFRSVLLSASEEGRRANATFSQNYVEASSDLFPNTNIATQSDVRTIVVNSPQYKLASMDSTINREFDVDQTQVEASTPLSESAASSTSQDPPDLSYPPSSQHHWERGSDQAAQATLPSIPFGVREHCPPSLSGSDLSSSPTLLNNKPRPSSFFARWINMCSHPSEATSYGDQLPGIDKMTPVSSSWGSFKWWKSLPLDHRGGVSAASSDVGLLPV